MKLKQHQFNRNLQTELNLSLHLWLVLSLHYLVNQEAATLRVYRLTVFLCLQVHIEIHWDHPTCSLDVYKWPASAAMPPPADSSMSKKRTFNPANWWDDAIKPHRWLFLSSLRLRCLWEWRAAVLCADVCRCERRTKRSGSCFTSTAWSSSGLRGLLPSNVVATLCPSLFVTSQPKLGWNVLYRKRTSLRLTWTQCFCFCRQRFRHFEATGPNGTSTADPTGNLPNTEK